MAKKTNVSGTFRIIAIVAAALLLGAGLLIYLQGTPGGALPGESRDWQALESQSTALIAQREAIETLEAAGAELAAASADVVGVSEALLDRAGSPDVIQAFQQRADRIGRNAARLAGADAQALTAEIAADLDYLENVAAALRGEASEFDIPALGAADREALLVPLGGSLATMRSALAEAEAAAGDVSGLGDLQAGLAESAARITAAADSAAGPGLLASRWIPLGLVLVAIVLIAALVALNAKSSVFEQSAREQAEQNERNQQAILRLLDEMGSLADGDLTVEATVTEDITGTIADSFNYAIEELRKLVATVNETAIMVDSAAKQTENTAAHMAKAAENQAREISAASESIVSMAASIEEVSGNAERSSDVARHSVEVAHKGGEAVRRTIDGMNTIRETIQETSKRIKRLGESSQEIGNIIELINDIAEQTNILALNASIQASMAGEAGRGFAVVADEVQRLAERSTNATKQIEVLVRTIQTDTNEAVVSMERSTTDVVGGALLAENAGAALDEIEQVSNQIASLVQNISGSARQQAGAAADVTRRTTRLREISEQTGKATTATAAAISKLSELASQLRQTVAGFTLPNSVLQGGTLAASAAKPAQGKPAPAPEKQAQTG